MLLDHSFHDLNNGLNLLGVSSYYQMIVKAVVILLAVLVDNKKQ